MRNGKAQQVKGSNLGGNFRTGQVDSVCDRLSASMAEIMLNSRPCKSADLLSGFGAKIDPQLASGVDRYLMGRTLSRR